MTATPLARTLECEFHRQQPRSVLLEVRMRANVPGTRSVSSASVSSSLYEHVVENGRTFHKYKQGSE